MKKIVIESPYAATDKYSVADNIEFARKCCKLACDVQHAPIASHLLYTQFLDDNNPVERETGIACGIEWALCADEVWFCLREGESFSCGMQAASTRYYETWEFADWICKTNHLRLMNDGTWMKEYHCLAGKPYWVTVTVEDLR